MHIFVVEGIRPDSLIKGAIGRCEIKGKIKCLCNVMYKLQSAKCEV